MGKKKKKKQKKMGVSKISAYLIALVLDIVVGGLWYYTAFPALNIHNYEFWLILLVLITVDTFLIALLQYDFMERETIKPKKVLRSIGKGVKFVAIVDLLIMAVVLIGTLAGWKLFRAKDYASLLKIEERNFAEDIKESESVSNIALMDTDSARKFGNREIGSLADVVSQYEVEEDYNQINISGTPMKVSSLKYASFFKWLKNRDKGVPGYVQVNAVNSDASYMKVKSGMKYVPSAYFNDNLMRHIQFQYPTKMIDGYYFEVNDDGDPYFICPCVDAKVGLFNGLDVVGIIICDPVTGESQYYAVKDIPNWVDRVFDGDLCTQKYDWHGTLSKGYWNSVISQTGCKKTTDDYGYIALDDDVWIYTGVTSLNSDQSNVGVIMVNQRTSEARYYKVAGAEEYSAMKSAEGAVQEKKYEASFPSLINVKGQPTYIMVLKDSGGLVKMYAMVNVEQYNIVATGKTQTEVFSNYKKLLLEEGIKGNEDSEDNTVEITIADIAYIANDGETTVYLKDTNGNVFKRPFADDESMIFLNVGDTVKLSANYSEELSDEVGNQNIVYSFTAFEVVSKKGIEENSVINSSKTNVEMEKVEEDKATLDDVEMNITSQNADEEME